MDIGSIFLILALLVVVALFISRPFTAAWLSQASAAQDGAEEHELSALLAERDRLLNALQELDFDYSLGKIPAEDYPAQRGVLLQRGANVLRRLDTLQASEESSDAEARIEAVIAARRADAALHAGANNRRARVDTVAQLAEPDDQLETLIANRRRSRQEKAGGFCPQCGGPVQQSDRFCPKCGAKLM